MNKIINNFLLAGNKFMPELHLKQPGITYNSCEPLTKHRERIQKFRETGNLEKQLALEDLAKRTISDKILKDRAYETARNCGNYKCQIALSSMVYKVFDKKTGSVASENEQYVDQYNDNYHHSLNKKPIHAYYSDLTEQIETSPKAPKFKFNDRARITKYRNIFRKG